MASSYQETCFISFKSVRLKRCIKRLVSHTLIKLDENGEQNGEGIALTRGCQGTLVDSKTVVTTADCAFSKGSFSFIFLTKFFS